ncbi:Endonuclease/exonuclease/phosphatase [Crepidotus variabilis]|uniref:Endonuclease/exonuclease/phosphatase n=1 Tax=Crepidotus variabilis TaxID=179855 RepID=A0A9P6ELF7_9AGAR|nr:Endonuclease/exonuclease/phosphatase [Crepidotus variabilis]
MSSLAIASEFIRSSDELRAVLEVTQIVNKSLDSSPQTSPETRDRCVLLVVSHKDDWDLTEEGCLFVCKHRWMRSTSTGVAGANAHPPRSDELDIQKVLPIYGEFAVAMSQTKREILELRSSIVNSAVTAPKSVLEQPRSVITLNITPAEGLAHDNGTPLTFAAEDVEGLKQLLSECKSLKEASELDGSEVVNLAQSTTHFNWIKPYFSKKTTIAALTSVPQDLRQVNQPLLDRLSPSCAGHMGDDHADVRVMRDDWIRVQAKEASRRGKQSLTIRLGTFNVNGKMPTQDLSSWVQGNVQNKVNDPSAEPKSASTPSLPPLAKVSPLVLTRNPFDWIIRRQSSKTKVHEVPVKEDPLARVDEEHPDDPDMLVFGFQELDLSTEALLYSTSNTREDAWCHAIFASLGEKATNYDKLASKQLVGMLIIVIVKRSLKPCFGDVKTSMTGAGILGVLGNKGGTAIRVSFTPPRPPSTLDWTSSNSVNQPGPTTLTFVNAHLAAFDEMVDKRNSDFHDLSRRLTFENSAYSNSSLKEHSEEKSDVVDHVATQTIGLNPPLNVYEGDAVFWMGDLNYRVDVQDHEMRRTLRNEEWETRDKFDALLCFDQLKKAIHSKKAFFGFQECQISHMPTYRFSPGLMMDKLGYDLKRKPAWTDRILYMHGSGCQITPGSYTGHPQITLSDHRPVSAYCTVQVDLYDLDEHRVNIVKRFNEVSHLDSESDKGGLKIEETLIDFGQIHYGKSVERRLVIRNIGKSPRAFRFVPVQLDSPIHPEWIQIHPMTGILLGEETTEILLQADVNDSNAQHLNSGDKDLDGTLILHTMLGKDHFVSLSAEYQRTCFANKLSWLTRLRGPIRSFKHAADLLPESHSRNAPKEIIRLVNWLMTNNATSEQIFMETGKEDVIDIIRECLDTGDEFPYSPQTSDTQTRLAFASTLLRLLNSLPEAVIPSHLHPRCLEMSNRDEAFEVLDELHPAAVNVWISVTAFLHFVSQSLKEEQVRRIASVLAPILLRDDITSAALPIPPNEKSKFLMYFME